MATLSVNEILMQTMEAFKVRYPMITMFTNDFSSATAKLNDTITGHVAVLPGLEEYDATTGYEANADESSALITDVPVVLDRLRHVPVKVDYLDSLASKKNLYREAISNIAFVLGKSIIDYALSLTSSTNFSYSITYSTANTTKAALDAATAQLNTNGNPPTGRNGLVNTAAFNALESDPRISSGDYHGQRRTSNAYGVLQGVSGFDNVWEYPDFPSNSQNQSGFFGSKNSAIIATRVPADPTNVAIAAGIPAIAKFETVTDPDSGLTFLGIQWMKAGLFDVYVTIAALYGIKAGSQGGAANAITDKAGVRLVTQ